ncbi:hypothetical protein HanHA300_Chr04g0131301 [Helianthus annuus]|uniref:uncharacterized protein LOC110936569 isoform X1 n=1 Tax=Helianthus annuus TaxID=4232 RepID=UPI000B8F0A1E|nr:uncharacterized protein LOC110936569 isoform X1 [Helianthus annuus]KAJ0580615.1 hypothetical protein HanHA300_Chr04g0131301 [Helianthus annuus]KAJ0596569.1 hypothetical protein HanHA89_Chr04g0144311 [Helianthus annuus]KAJ0757231.1 hypothetical protein HanLR1_Chr04g0136261 [Helianthus annuus]KAJ0760953.1 hypothetical protein HanOQP8_Chr04g0144001 [Helianthus annuus]
MVATKGEGGSGGSGATVGGLTTLIQPITAECCMCGDFGLSQELFRCKICKNRFQHKYCSNQYPKAEFYKACNWCLAPKHDSGNSSNSSSSCRNNSGDDHRNHSGKTKRSIPVHRIGHGSLRERRKGLDIELTGTGLMKKVHGSSPEEESPVSTGRKRVVVEEKNHGMLRKSKSANHLTSGGGTKTRPVFRNKVRRYKLLDEVSSQ